MKVLCYPDYETGLIVTDATGPVRKVLKELLPDRAATYNLVERTFRKLENNEINIQILRSNKMYGSLFGKRIDEFRIPPKGRNGVFRAYCSIFKASDLKILWCENKVLNELDDNDDVIIILSAEIKKGYKAQADKIKLNEAENRLQIIKDRIRKEKKKNGKQR